jgi:hypothetical protein
MRLNLRKLLLNNGTLKISSCIIGFILWSILNESYRAHLTLAVPVCFYNVPEKCTINCPEEAQVTLSGTPAQVRNLDQQTVALHIDAQKLEEGTNTVALTTKNLLLPQELSLVKYKPIQLTLNHSDS